MKHARDDYNRIQDPYRLIPEDEPVFLIRGKDRVGPATVRAWTQFAVFIGAEQNIIDAALEQADRMEHWQQTVESKIPDMS